jgi:hypothetical protein
MQVVCRLETRLTVPTVYSTQPSCQAISTAPLFCHLCRKSVARSYGTCYIFQQNLQLIKTYWNKVMTSKCGCACIHLVFRVRSTLSYYSLNQDLRDRTHIVYWSGSTVRTLKYHTPEEHLPHLCKKIWQWIGKTLDLPINE